MDVKTFKNEGKCACVCVWLCVDVLVRGHAVCLLVLEVTFPRRRRVRRLRCVAIHTVGTAWRDGYVAKAVNAQRTGTATLEQERGGERGRGGEVGREGVCRQTKVRYQLLKAGQTNSVERPIEGRERVGGRGGGWRLPRRCRRWRWYRWVRLSSAEPATDPVAPAVIQCSLDRADHGWIEHILRMILRYQ